MAFDRFQDFLGSLVKGQRRGFFSGNGRPSIDELLDKLMGNTGEVSAIVAARELLDDYIKSDDDAKLAFFNNLEQNYNADEVAVKLAYNSYSSDPSSTNLNRLSKTAEPRRLNLLRRLNQTPGATHDLVEMRSDLLKLLKDNPQLRAVDDNFVRLFKSWFARSFLVLQTIDWSTPAAILERIIRYEAVHEIKDWEDLRRRIQPANRRCFAFFHPALTDEPLIFVEVALGWEIPNSINSILTDTKAEDIEATDFTTATFYSISNCQPGLQHISFGNFLIKQVVLGLQAEFPSIKQFVTLSPISGFKRWLQSTPEDEASEITASKARIQQIENTPEAIEENAQLIEQLVFNYLLSAKKGKYPADSVARFHLGNGAMIHQLHTAADTSEKGLAQAHGTMVNYLYDLRYIERNHERYVTEGTVEYNDKLKPLVIKP
ncbi:MAG: malonyl-CoA decarboxylase family protein [Gammaproteobacteria bacterium]|nr:malonyl-CoA decarboxylase family protein [Gammaproteobacteria bacterium]